MKRILSFFLAVLLAFNPMAHLAYAQVALVPGQVNDDTDIFLINPNVASERPNVLIIWDNTANWGQTVDGNTAYSLEKQALQTVINGLSNQFNVGLMLFTETGGGNSNIRGSYPRYAIRQMDATNKATLTTLINGLDQGNDRGSNAQYARALYEASLYFGGQLAMAGSGQVKRDAAAFDASGNRYVSPQNGGCQKNYVIFIGNGPTDSSENNGEEARLTSLGGKRPTDPIPLSPDAEQANWQDEYGRYFGSTDIVPGVAGTQSMTVFTLMVYDQARVNQRTTASVISLLKSTGRQSGGDYYAATSLQSIIDALNSAFKRIEADDSIFTSSTLPVSVNVRGTQLNQVYMGVFRPDASMGPRWFGNLKMYKFGLDRSTNPPSVILTDSLDNRADDASNGFIVPNAKSFWTTDSTFWAYRAAALNGAGGSSDSPDGDKVEKGGVAQQLRIANASSQDGRNLYTCTGTCSANSLLSGTLFNSANTDITDVALGVSADADPVTSRNNLIRWMRGEDNATDENTNGSLTDVRASIHGDVLHSQPVLINYNRNNDDNDIVAFYGANDGVFRAIQGGLGTGGGGELWGFVPPEMFGKLKRLRDNSPTIDISNKKPYFMDGPIGVYQKDVPATGFPLGDGRLVAADGDKVHLFIGMRRGGRLIYALDVSNPTAPRMLWKRTNADPGFEEMGYTWSEPKVAMVRAHPSGPVLIMAAGYDPRQDTDPVDPATPDQMGRGVMVIDALNGNLLWWGGNAEHSPSYTISGMDYSIPSDVTILNRDNDPDGFIDRIYVGDTGGNVWRIDTNFAAFSDWTAIKLASVGGTNAADKRKFLYPPDVVYSKDANGLYDAVLIGTGDREHPFNTTVVNRFYMFKDRVTGLVSSMSPAITEADLYDATRNTIQVGNSTAQTTAQGDLTGAQGWMVKLVDDPEGKQIPNGEKVISGSITVGGTTFFNTNKPTPANSAVCSAQGIALQYALNFQDASATIDGGQVGLSTADRASVYPGGGYLPPPKAPLVPIDGGLYQPVCSGPACRMPPQTQLGARYRTYWYISTD